VTPDRQLYIYYPTTGGTHRNRGGDEWMYGYEWMKPVSDLASSEFYYRHFNSGWTGSDNMLTQALNARGFEIAQGQPLAYDWISDGWPREKGLGAGTADPLKDGGLGDLALYTGFLKCLYTTGAIGANAGYYAYPKGGFGIKFPADQPPHWLQQMIATARVHALFTNLEDFQRKGSLLPGPNKHVWSKEQPAYEFPTGNPNTRVLARKLQDKPEWLVTAWAADGKDGEVTVDIPELPQLTITARACGSVYRVTLKDGKSQIVRVDEDYQPPYVPPVALPTENAAK
jgi:hypothetical protein